MDKHRLHEKLTRIPQSGQQLLSLQGFNRCAVIFIAAIADIVVTQQNIQAFLDFWLCTAVDAIYILSLTGYQSFQSMFGEKRVSGLFWGKEQDPVCRNRERNILADGKMQTG